MPFGELKALLLGHVVSTNFRAKKRVKIYPLDRVSGMKFREFILTQGASVQTQLWKSIENITTGRTYGLSNIIRLHDCTSSGVSLTSCLGRLTQSCNGQYTVICIGRKRKYCVQFTTNILAFLFPFSVLPNIYWGSWLARRFDSIRLTKPK